MPTYAELTSRSDNNAAAVTINYMVHSDPILAVNALQLTIPTIRKIISHLSELGIVKETTRT